jgi:hypothetical protein
MIVVLLVLDKEIWHAKPVNQAYTDNLMDHA